MVYPPGSDLLNKLGGGLFQISDPQPGNISIVAVVYLVIKMMERSASIKAGQMHKSMHRICDL